MSTLLGPCEIGGGGGRVAEDDVKEVTDEIKLGPCEIGGGGGRIAEDALKEVTISQVK